MHIDKNNIVSLDFETFYDVGYSLTDTKMNMSEYVRDPRFKTQCVGIKIGDGPVHVYNGKEAVRAIQSIDWENKYLLAHNTAFDGFILHHHFGVQPKGYLDTMCMSRALFGHHVPHNLDAVAERLGLGNKIKGALLKTKGIVDLPEDIEATLMEYCAVDVELCTNVFWTLYPYFPDSELRLIDLTLKMFCRPLLQVDSELVEGEIESQRAAKEALLSKLEKRGITREDLMSNDKFAEVLRREGIPVPMKKNAKGKDAYAFAKTDKQFQLYLESDDEAIREIFQARKGVKTTIAETRAIRFRKAGDRMPMPVLLNYYGAHTGRWSGGNKLNLQNLPRGGALRKALRAPNGMVVVVADSSQIEARTTAWLAGEHSIVTAFAQKKDVYRQMASRIYGVPEQDVTEIQRFVGKTCILGLGYGMGAEKLKATLALGVNGPKVELSLAECNKIVNIYRTSNPFIAALWRTMNGILRSMVRRESGELKCIGWDGAADGGRILLPNGLKLLYPEISMTGPDEIVYATRYGHTKVYGGLLTENVVQALARIAVAEQMLAIGERYPVVTMSHDEIVWLAPESEADEALEFGKKIMVTPPSWAPTLPLDVKGGYDYCYSK